ncbi:hypothetical protein [Paenalcaligenes hermetiae]|uniref:Uncharacterized protein n=1 Tax=Paenalcaligenes hermetiae TaxID=1157987 RepID=A0ABP9M8A1_9BURK
MTYSIKEALAAKGVYPTDEHLKKLEQKWQETLALKGDLAGVPLSDADLAIKNVAGGDHYE